MRRNDREIVDRGKIFEIMRACDCCRVGFIDGDSAYIVPLNFGFMETGISCVLYFHGANEGKKLELAQAGPKVGFEMDTQHKLHTADAACGYSFGFQSIVGKGLFSIVADEAEKCEALRCIMRHYTSKDDWRFADSAMCKTAVFKLVVTELSCKEHP